MKPHLILAGLLLAWCCSAQAAGVFRWVDKDGNVHYGDMPAEGAAQVQQKKFGEDHEIEDAALPFETRRARQKFPVTLYVSANCIDACQQARELLNKRGIPFTEKKLSTQEEIESFRKESGDNQVPTLKVGRSWLLGFLPEQWSGQLDDAGYPRFASYVPPNTPGPTSPPASTPVMEKRQTE
ncbi:MAG: glutaredoxin family protein [Nitrosomonadales bacterium]|nr:glutaredoxin family protein [Nitrosomonadales bacterium]